MTAAPIVTAIFDHARRSPEQPWLFYRPELDWRWRSWYQVAAQIVQGPLLARPVQAGPVSDSSGAGAASADPRLDPGGAVVYPWYAHPDVLAFDLAVAAAGWAPAPLSPRGSPPGSAMGSPPAWPPSRQLLDTLGAVALGRLGHGLVGLPKQPGGGAGANLPRLEPAAAPGCFERPVPLSPRTAGPPAGPVWVMTQAGPRQVSQERLGAAVEICFGALPRPGRRDVMVLGRCLSEPFQRLLVSWAATVGAAIVLEPAVLEPAVLEPEAAEALPVATIRWVRPTVLHGTAAELRELGERLPPRFRRTAPARCWLGPLHPPYDRLRVVVVLGPDPLDGAAEASWREAGAELLHLAETPFERPSETQA